MAKMILEKVVPGKNGFAFEVKQGQSFRIIDLGVSKSPIWRCSTFIIRARSGTKRTCQSQVLLSLNNQRIQLLPITVFIGG